MMLPVGWQKNANRKQRYHYGNYRKYVDSQIGSFMSFLLPPSTAPLRLSNKIKGLKNVILATQWLQAPGGLPIAAEAGLYSIKRVLKCEKKAARTNA